MKTQELLDVAKTPGIVYGGVIQPEIMSREDYLALPEWRNGEYEVLANGLESKEDADRALENAPTTR